MDQSDYAELEQLLADEAAALAGCARLLRLARHRIRELETLTASLCTTISERDATIAEQQATIASQAAALEACGAENARLTAGLAQLRDELDRLLHPPQARLTITFDQPTKRST